MNYTKGNWKVDKTTPNTISVVSPWSKEVTPENTMTFGDYRGALICEMHYNSGVPTKEQALANAKLIAAASDLLKACITVLERKTNQQGETPELVGGLREVLENAIKKATE
jgi:hypothetical protein